ncbi:MAG TPA: hypothetical protein VGK13_01630 [Methanocellaceae archaeon]
MNVKYIFFALLIAAGIAISGCTSPPPSATVSPTVLPPTTSSLPTSVPNATPAVPTAPVTNVTPTVTVAPPVSSGTASTRVGNLTVSGVSIDWDTMDALQHDTAHVTLQSVDPSVIQDVTVNLTVSTPSTLVNPDGTSSVVSQPIVSSVYLGKMSPNETKTVTLPTIDHAKNVPATATIKILWKGGDGNILQTTLSPPDYRMGTQTY